LFFDGVLYQYQLVTLWWSTQANICGTETGPHYSGRLCDFNGIGCILCVFVIEKIR
jgi:hypothetical protein